MPETTVATEQRTLSIPLSVKELVEALIFASSEPLTVKQLKNIMAESGQAEGLNIESVVDTINEEYQQANKPYRIVRIAGGFQFSTVPDYAEWVGKLYKEQGKRKLSQSSLETLAIIAYRQPITRPDIEAIRGVDCDYVLGTLLEKKLVTISGRAPTPGRPLLYGTTDLFLKHFGLNDISDLPKPREIEELLADSRYETERRMLEAQEQAEAEKKKQEEEDFKSRLPHIPKKKPEMDDPVEIVPKKLNRELGVPKEDETGEPVQETTDQTVVENLEPQQPETLEENDLQGSVESVSDEQDEVQDVQIEDSSTINLPVDYSPMENAEEVVDEEESIKDELLEESEVQKTEVLDHAPEVISEESTQEPVVEEPAQPEIEMSIPEQPTVVEDEQITDEQNIETELRLTEDLVPEEEEEQEEIVDELVIEEPAQEEISDAPAVELEPVVEPTVEEKQTTAEEAPTESAPTVEDVQQPTNEVTAEAPQEATFEAVPPYIAPVVEEREPAKSKSRWQQFKEKVQGFLKKVFG